MIQGPSKWTNFAIIFVCLASAKLVTANYNTSLHPWPGFSPLMYVTRDLLANLSKLGSVRPSQDPAKPLLISTSIHFNRLLAYDAAEQMVVFLGMVVRKYQHDGSKWDPESYDGIDSVALEPHRIWIPDVILLNGLKTSKAFDIAIKARAYATGFVYVDDPLVYQFPCAANMRNFPFDIQTCVMHWGSLHYDANEFFYLPDAGFEFDFVELESYYPNNEWILLNTFTKNVNVTRQGHKYEEIQLTIVLKRFSEFYFQFLMIPTIVLACVVSILFWIPAVRPDRTAVGMGVFGGLMLLLLMVVRISPPSADMKIGTYYCMNVILVVISTAMSALIVSISQRTSVVPFVIRKICVAGIGYALGITQQYERVFPVDDNMDIILTSIRDWQVVACVLDRICFVSYIICILAGIGLFFPVPAEVELERPPLPFAGKNQSDFMTFEI